MTAEQKHQMMTETPINSLIMRMAIPSIISMLVTSLYNMADTFFIGQLNNVPATASIGIVFPLMNIIQAIGFFLGQGSGNTVSRLLGKKDMENAERTVATGFFGAIIMGLVFTTLGLAFIEPLMKVLGATETIMPYAIGYGKYIMIGSTFKLASIVLNVQMRFQGNAFFSMIGIATGAVLNIFLDPLFIHTFGMGVEGAAIATAISQCVSFLLLLGGTYKGGNIRLKLKAFTLKWSIVKPIVLGGMPSMCRQGLASVANICMNLAATTYGGVTPEAIDAAVAALGVVNRIMQFCASCIMGIGQGFQPVCGFNYGAKKYGRVRKGFMFTLEVMVVIMIVFSIVGITFPGQIVAIFNNDPTVIEFGTVTLRWQCLVFPLMSVVFNANMAMQTMGMAGRSTVLSMARQGVCFIPMILILPPIIGATGIQIAQACADAFAFAITVPMLLPVLKMLKQKDEEQNKLSA